MRIGGWKIPSIVGRYNIVDENDLRVAVVKYQAAQKAALEAIEAEKQLRTSLAAAPSEGVSAPKVAERERVN